MSANSDHVTIIGKTTGRYRPRLYGIRQPDRLMHMYIIGQTGVGKTTFLHNLMRQDIAARRGFCFIDPHGDLAGEMAASDNGCDFYWNPADPACPLGYNPLSYVTPEFRPLLASGLIDTLKKQWADACPNRVARLARLAGIHAEIGDKPRPGSYGGRPAVVVDNTLDRPFDVAAPDKAPKFAAKRMQGT